MSVPDDRPASDLVHAVVRATLSVGGATADVPRSMLVDADDAWYFPRFPERTRIVPQAGLDISLQGFVDEHRDALHEPGISLGTWINPETGMCYVDLITCTADQNEAVALARRYSEEGGRKIVAICNPVRGATRYVWDDVRQ